MGGDFIRKLRCGALIVGTVLTAGALNAQEMPRPEGEAVDATVHNEQFETRNESFQTVGPDGVRREVRAQRRIPVVAEAYRSRTLRAKFIAQWMYIIQRGEVINFWGARIVGMDPTSPLVGLGVRPGDVITRIDGVPIWHGMHRDGVVWDIPELERHYGATEIRFILRGSHRVRIGQVVLDTLNDDDDISPIAP